MSNELFAIHHDGKQVNATEFNRLIGNSSLWTPPKRVYKRRSDAERAIERLPAKHQSEFSVVRYIPEPQTVFIDTIDMSTVSENGVLHLRNGMTARLDKSCYTVGWWQYSIRLSQKINVGCDDVVKMDDNISVTQYGGASVECDKYDTAITEYSECEYDVIRIERTV